MEPDDVGPVSPSLLKHLGRSIRDVLNSPEAERLPAEMKELLAKLDDMLADKGKVASESDLSAEDPPV
jgi:hypothetical protein